MKPKYPPITLILPGFHARVRAENELPVIFWSINLLRKSNVLGCPFYHEKLAPSLLIFRLNFSPKHMSSFSVWPTTNMGRFSAHDSRPFCNVDRPRSTRHLTVKKKDWNLQR
jgi:hypothetical protein